MRLVYQPWYYGQSPVGTDAAVSYINDRLRDLERTLAVLFRGVNNGPVPGGYLSIPFHRDKGAAFIANDETIAVRTNFEITPLFFTAHTDAGSVTCQLRDGTTDLLGADLDTAAGSPWVNTLSGFTVAHTARAASLRVRVTGVTGTPNVIHAVLVGSQIQKVDDPQGV